MSPTVTAVSADPNLAFIVVGLFVIAVATVIANAIVRVIREEKTNS